MKCLNAARNILNRGLRELKTFGDATDLDSCGALAEKSTAVGEAGKENRRLTRTHRNPGCVSRTLQEVLDDVVTVWRGGLGFDREAIGVITYGASAGNLSKITK